LSGRGKPRVLFVCSRNQWRSPTAERIYRNDPRIEVRSAGVASSAKRRLSEKDLTWADLVLVMERKHAAFIRQQYQNHPDLPALVSLDIPDEYRFMDSELVQLLRDKIESEIQDF
jgi:predicted protein tyrosine phosphatase